MAAPFKKEDAEASAKDAIPTAVFIVSGPSIHVAFMPALPPKQTLRSPL